MAVMLNEGMMLMMFVEPTGLVMVIGRGATRGESEGEHSQN
jgi:hypothetical protein